MNNTPIIQCEQLVADTTYFDYTGNAIDMSAYPGKIISILGPDYCGKSDWLKTLIGLSFPSSGKLSILGKNIDDMGREDWVQARKNLAYVRHDGGLLSAANSLQNVMMGASYHRMGPKQEIREKALNMLDAIRADCDYDVLPAFLRKDQQYKVAVARALMLEPQVLALDNPFTLLDASDKALFKLFLFELVKSRNILLILVTHDIKFAMNNSDQILFVTQDHVHQFSSGEEMTNSSIPAITDYLEKSFIQ